MSDLDPRTPAGVEKVAELSRLALGEAERAELATHLSKMLDYVAALQQVDTSGIDPTATDRLGGALRPDVVTPSLEREQALANAPRRAAEGFEVPRVVAE